jgi:hypothetical protein
VLFSCGVGRRLLAAFNADGMNEVGLENARMVSESVRLTAHQSPVREESAVGDALNVIYHADSNDLWGPFVQIGCERR